MMLIDDNKLKIRMAHNNKSFKTQQTSYSPKLPNHEMDNQNKSLSKLSSRSQSKFKKVSLQKSEIELTPNDRLQKSELKLNSVEKIKLSVHNRSYISNYSGLNHTSTPNPQVSSSMFTNTQKIIPDLEAQKTKKIQVSRSEQLFLPKFLDKKTQHGPSAKQGYALFPKNTNNFEINQSINNQQKDLADSPSQKLQRFLQKMKVFFIQFRQASEDTKKKLNQNALKSFLKLQKTLETHLQQLQANIEIGIKKMIKIVQFPNQPGFKIENQLENSQLTSLKSNYESKMKYLENEQSLCSEEQKYQGINRLNSFKNRFKQLIDENGQKIVAKNKIQKQTFNNNSQSKEKTHNLITRKRANLPSRVNCHIGIDCSFQNGGNFNQELNASSNSMKYCRINDKSGSKSVKKLHQKIALIKNIFKTQNAPPQNQKDSSIIFLQNK